MSQSHAELTVYRYRDEETSPSRWQETGNKVTSHTRHRSKTPRGQYSDLTTRRDQVWWREDSRPELYKVHGTHSKG